jgi:hypothetical protein
MKGFIEVTGHADGNKHLINTTQIVDFFQNNNTNCVAILLSNLSSEQALGVKETYDEIKALIEEAQKEDEPSFVITSNKCGFEMPDGTFRGFRNEETQQ